ncbi:MAG: leucine-rich repeat domain-containing protein [Ruminococcaceae bacterium]|nr:leucine-rich repeat domain-containing protein [Oscillospiraceae bacterium]
MDNAVVYPFGFYRCIFNTSCGGLFSMKKLLAIILVVLMSISVVSCNRKKDEEEKSSVKDYADSRKYQIKDANGTVLGELTYDFKGTDEAIITKYTPSIADLHSVVIPEVIPDAERTVVGIGSEAFYACSYVTAVYMPNTITHIGDGAFYQCSAMYKVILPEELTSIGKNAFAECSSLTIIQFCEDAVVSTIGDRAFSRCSIEQLAIPEGVKTIGQGAFFECEYLTSVSLPDSVEAIGEAAFAGCEAIEQITLGANIKEMGEYALGTIPTDTTEILVFPEGSVTAGTIDSVYEAIDELPEDSDSLPEDNVDNAE